MKDLLEFRKEKSGRTNYIGRCDAITGIGPWRILDERGEYGSTGNQFWTLTRNGAAPTKEVILTGKSKSQATITSQPIDTFTPNILVPSDYLGIIMATPKDEPVRTVLKRAEGQRIFSLTGQFRLKELQNLGFEKPITYPGMFANHMFVCNVVNVTDKAFLKSIATAGGYSFTETDAEFQIKFDPSKTLNLVNRSREFYGLDDPNSLLGSRLILKHKVLPTLTPDVIDQLARVDNIEIEVDSRSPLRSDIDLIVNLSTKLTPEIKKRIKPDGRIKLSIYGYCNVSPLVEMDNGRFWGF